ncbi:reverse transcriptase domain-containing protein [Tanacetum coccineum]
MKFSNVPSTSVKLMLFPFSLEGAARIWLEKEPPRSILTWDDLVSKFINKFFPPSKTTNLRNEITRFQQRFDETFYEAWDRFNDLLRACPHHGFLELHQLDTFYNALNSNDQDSLNSAAGGSGTLPSNTITNRRKIERRSFLKTGRALIDVYIGELTLRVEKEAVTFNLDQTSRYSSNYDDMTANRIDVIEMACEEYSQEVLGFSDVIASGNPTPYYDPIVSTSSQTLTPFGDSDFLLEEVDASYYDPEGDILLLEAFLNDDPSLLPPNQGNYLPEIRKELKVCEAKTVKSSIEEPPEVELKDLPPHLEYAFLEGNNKLPVIIAKDLSVEEKATLIKVLKSHKQASLGNSRDNKDKMLQRCEDTNLCLNWEKSHFMVKEGIVLGHKISKNRIEVDKAKRCVANYLIPTTDKGARIFSNTHRLSTEYHPQTSGQVEVSNHGLKRILKRTMGENRASWSHKLDDCTLASVTLTKHPSGVPPTSFVNGKSIHPPIELEHKSLLGLEACNFDLRPRKTEEDPCLKDQKPVSTSVVQVLLFNSRLNMFSGKLKSRWSGPFTIAHVFPYGTVELSQNSGPNFKDCPGFLKPLVLAVLSFDHKSFKSSASFGKSINLILSTDVI